VIGLGGGSPMVRPKVIAVAATTTHCFASFGYHRIGAPACRWYAFRRRPAPARVTKVAVITDTEQRRENGRLPTFICCPRGAGGL